MEVGLVHKVDIDQEMQQAYLDYAMSVIVARALPDARDGLKPVHRRILYAMHDMGLRPEQSYKKSARIVGEVLGKYHPHGDMAVYEAMARMAQDFSLRYMLVDGQGNFGSVDGDPPAAMRYTEARLATLATQMLADIGKNTVDFSDNFDGTLTEPTVLPAALPNLLVNGATGIAVGMATSIPPHNLNEIVDAMQYLLQNWERLDDISIEDLLQFVQGPDFPTGGLIVQAAGGDGLVSAYSTGRGQVTIQARTHLEEMERGRSRIIVTELPYMTNKSSLIERIAELAREERLEGIADLRDESDRQGMRIVIELSKTADPEKTLKDLLKHTPLQTTFSFIMLALVDGEPRHLSLKQAMRVYLEHRIEIVRRRSQYDLDRARQRSHILEGLRVALKNLDEVIDIIRKSPDVEAARTRLMKRFKLTEIQTQAILEMPLRRLAALERKKIEEEYKEIQALIKDLEGLLRSPKKMRQVVGDELLAVKEQFGDRRRTHIIQLKEGQTTASLLTDADSIPDKTIWLSITANGLISRSLDDSLPQLSGQDAPSWLVRASTRDTLYLVSESGDAASLPVHAVPETSSPTQGAPLNKVSALGENTPLAAAFTLPARSGKEATTAGDEKRFVLSVSRQGMVKKSPVSELPGASASMFTLARVNEEDRLGWVIVTSGLNELLLVTAGGMGIRFKEEEVRPMGLAAAGVMGIKLAGNDELAGVEIFDRAGDLFLATDTGKAKRVPLPEFPLQGRYGQGVQTWKLNVGERIIGSAIGKGTTRIILHPSRLLPKALRLDEAPMQTRAGRGVNILEQKGGDHILRLTMPIVPYHLEAFSPVAGEKEGGKAVARKRAPAAAPPTKQQAAQPVKKSAAGKAAKKTADAKTAAVKIPGEKSTGKTSPKGSPSAKTATVKKAAEKPTPASTAPAKTLPPKTAPAKKAAGKTAATRSTAEKGSSGKATTGKVGTEKAAVSKTAGGKAASSKQVIVQPPVTKKPASIITAAPTGAPVEKTNPPAVKASKTTPPKKLPAAKSAPQKETPAAKKGTRGSQKAKEAPAAQKSPAAKKAPPTKGTTPDKKAPVPKKTPAEKPPAQAPAASKTAVPKAPPAIPQKAQRKTKTDSSG